MAAEPVAYPHPAAYPPRPGQRPAWAEALIAHRVAGEWTVHEVARAACLNARALFRIENTDPYPPHPLVLARLAGALGLSPEEAARLFISAGYWPPDGTLDDVATLLFAEDGMPPALRPRFRQQVAAWCARFLAEGGARCD